MDAAQGMSPQRVRVRGGEMLTRGRVNGTKAAREEIADNVLSIRDPTLAAQDAQHGDAHRRHRQPSVGRGMRE